MHCVSTYPMKDEDANLKAIITLRESISVTLVILAMSPHYLKWG